MSEESQLYDKKSLRVLKGGDQGMRDLASDCVAFANASGGHIHTRIGLEIPERQLRTELLAMVKDGLLLPFGLRGGCQYELTKKR